MKEKTAEATPTRSPIQIDFEKGYFFGKSGRKYVFLDSLPIDYFIQYQMLIPEVTYGVEFVTLAKTLKGAYEALTSGNEILKAHRIASDLLFNQMAAIKSFTDTSRHQAILRMAALWIVTEDEDLTQYDQRVADQKIEDWKATGLAMTDFFLLCGQKIDYFKEIYLEFHQRSEDLEKKSQPTGSIS